MASRVAGIAPRHLAQGSVAKDDVSRDAPFVGETLAKLTQTPE